MSHGLEFTTGNGETFQLDEINPHVFLQEVRFTGAGGHSRTVSFPSLTGNMEVSAVWVDGAGNGDWTQNASKNYNVSISAPSSDPAEVTVSVSPQVSSSNAFWVFHILARSIR